MRYGQRPSSVKRWSVDEFDEAFIIWQGEAEYKVTEEEVKEDAKAASSGGVVLSKNKAFWSKLIVNGSLDHAAVLAKKYRAEQIPFIESEMKRLEWL